MHFQIKVKFLLSLVNTLAEKLNNSQQTYHYVTFKRHCISWFYYVCLNIRHVHSEERGGELMKIGLNFACLSICFHGSRSFRGTTWSFYITRDWLYCNKVLNEYLRATWSYWPRKTSGTPWRVILTTTLSMCGTNGLCSAMQWLAPSLNLDSVPKRTSVYTDNTAPKASLFVIPPDAP